MRELLLRLWSENRKTVMFITHDIEEAIRLADRVLVFSPRPGHVKASFAVDLPRPRPEQLFADPEYLELRDIITKCLISSSDKFDTKQS